jgi:hypothetical protein
MYEHASAFNVNHRQMAQPLEQLNTVGRCENLVQGIVGTPLDESIRHCQQVKIVIAEDAHRPIAKIAHEAQRLEGSRSAVHQIADKPETVHAAIEPNRTNQRPKFRETALNIADRVRGHGRRLFR